MKRNKSSVSKWVLFVFIGLVGSTHLVSGQTVSSKKNTVSATPIYETVNARAYQSAPVTVYKKVGPYSLVTWNTLSHFDYEDPDQMDEDGRITPRKRKKITIPGFITSLNTLTVAVVGFMLPMDMDDKGEKTTGFILSRSQSACCYGIMPKMNEWIYVHMKKGLAMDIMMDIPVTAFGTLDVGEQNDKENGWSFYRMTGDKVGYPKESTW